MISCDQHDHIEIACMHRYQVRLVLVSGEAIEGVAQNTQYDADKRECIELVSGGESRLVPTQDLSSLQVLSQNPAFCQIDFR